jgi:hypothetical protein
MSTVYMMTPPIKPMTMAAQGATKAQAAVMATSAAIAPLPIIPTSRWRLYR